jgi:DnaK suppressor protein
MPAKKTIAKTQHAKKPVAKPSTKKPAIASKSAASAKAHQPATKSATHKRNVIAKPTAAHKTPAKAPQHVIGKPVKAPAKVVAPPKAPVKPIAAKSPVVTKPAVKVAAKPAAPPPPATVKASAPQPAIKATAAKAPDSKVSETKRSNEATKPTVSASAKSAVPKPPVVKAIGKSETKPTAFANQAVSLAKSSKAPVNSSAADADDDVETSASLLSGPRNVTPYQPKRGEQYMNQEQLEHFRTILQSWKKDLMTEVDRTVLHMKDEAANFPDPNDRATQESEFSLELRTRDRERKLIRKIEEALNRIEDGSYGYCSETGEEIGIKRLEARPVATLSVEAQERRERRERQYGDRDDRYR